MAAFSIWQLLIFLFVMVLFNLPAIWVFRKAGWSPWFILLLVIPVVGIVTLWVFAFARWPNEANYRGKLEAFD